MVGRSQYDYSDKTAIVTGSTKGIGRGIAAKLVDAGSNVVVNARTEEDVDRVANELSTRAEGNVLGISGDVSDFSDIDEMISTTIEEFGAIHLLVNNAAVWPEGPMHQVGVDEWDYGLNVNARGPYYFSTRVAQEMIENDIRGCVVNITSQAGERHGAGHGLYGVSKAAQNGLTWRLAYDLARYGIRVNAVSTSQTDSYQLRKSLAGNRPVEDLSEAEIEAWREELAEEIPLGRLGEPEDIGDGVLFLASDSADYITGHVLRVSGGSNLQ